MAKKKKKWWYRSSITGKFVSAWHAVRHPKITTREEVEVKPKRKKKEGT